MKLLLIVLPLMGLYVYGLLLAADTSLRHASNLAGQYQHVTTTADQWSVGNTSVSFVPGT